jgi:hypothetical protein
MGNRQYAIGKNQKQTVDKQQQPESGGNAKLPQQ